MEILVENDGNDKNSGNSENINRNSRNNGSVVEPGPVHTIHRLRHRYPHQKIN